MAINKWSISQVLTVNKSKFKGFCIPINSSNDIPLLLKDLRNIDRKLEDASHPTMLAWKTCKSTGSSIIPKPENLNQGSNDCGEGGSGARLLGLLDRLHLVNVLVVVSRWYGGKPLGPSRFKCISDVGHEAISNGGYLMNMKQTNKSVFIDANCNIKKV